MHTSLTISASLQLASLRAARPAADVPPSTDATAAAEEVAVLLAAAALDPLRGALVAEGAALAPGLTPPEFAGCACMPASLMSGPSMHSVKLTSAAPCFSALLA